MRGRRHKLRVHETTVVLSLLAAMIILLAACGDDDAPAEGSDAAETDEEPAEGDEQPEEAEAEDPGDAVADFYAENEVILGVTVSPGGGLDAGARAIAPYFAEELGTTVTVVNQPMGDTSIPENWIMDAESDGLHLLLGAGASLFLQPFTQPSHVRYDHESYSTIGRPWTESRGIYVGEGVPYHSVDDILEAGEFRAGSSGFGSSSWTDLMVFFTALGLEPDIIDGYPGTSETELGILRGEIQGTAGPTGTMARADENPELRPLVTLSEERDPALPDVPSIYEAETLEMDAEQREFLQAHIGVQTGMGRFIIAPKDVPEDRLQYLRDALARALEHPDLQEQMASTNRPLDPLIGDDYHNFILDLVESTPESYIEFLADIAN